MRSVLRASLQASTINENKVAQLADVIDQLVTALARQTIDPKTPEAGQIPL